MKEYGKYLMDFFYWEIKTPTSFEVGVLFAQLSRFRAFKENFF